MREAENCELHLLSLVTVVKDVVGKSCRVILSGNAKGRFLEP